MLGTSDLGLVDWFLVSSNTTSYSWFLRMQQQGLVSDQICDTYLTSGCQRYVHSNDKWAWRETASGGLEFNLNRYPRMRKNQHGTVLIQHFQLWKCREMTLRFEEKHGLRYDRLIRLRTDVVFARLHGHHEGKQQQPPPLSQQPQQRLRSGVGGGGGGGSSAYQPADIRRAKCLSAGFVRTLAGRSASHWAFVHDWAMAGSRAAMVDVFMAGLEHLQGVSTLHGIQVAWQVLQQRAVGLFGKGNVSVYIGGYATGCELDLAGTVGPPRSRFYLQLTEAKHLEECKRQMWGWDECRRRYVASWHLSQVERSGLNFTYDWPPSECVHGPRSVAGCVAQAHASSFGADNLVGDPGKFAGLGLSNKTPGYVWAGASNEITCARDGWQ